MPKVEWPYTFEGGLVGARCTQDIQHLEPLILVPYKLIITAGKAAKHPIVGKIIENHPDCFGEEDNQDWE